MMKMIRDMRTAGVELREARGVGRAFVCGRTVAGILLIAALCARVDAASSVGLNFAAEEKAMAASEKAGVVLSAANWNNLTGTTGFVSALTNGAGAVSGLSVEWSGFEGTYCARPSGSATNGDENMMFGYLDNRSFEDHGTATVKVSGVKGPYDVYVYFGSDSWGRRGSVGIEGLNTYSFKTHSRDGFFPDSYMPTEDTKNEQPKSNYAVWKNLTAPEFTLIFTSILDYSTGLSGLQIVWGAGDMKAPAAPAQGDAAAAPAPAAAVPAAPAVVEEKPAEGPGGDPAILQ